MKVLNIKGSSCRGLPTVGEAHQFGIVIFAAGQYVIDLCSQQLCSAAETRTEALNRLILNQALSESASLGVVAFAARATAGPMAGGAAVA